MNATQEAPRVRPGSRVARALDFIDHVRVASHIEIADHLGIAPWRASGVCAYLHRRGLISLGGYDARIGDVLRVVGFPSGPSIWDLLVENAFGHRFPCALHEVVRHNY